MENRLTKEEFGIRQKITVRVHADKFLSEGEILDMSEILGGITKILGLVGDCYRMEIIRTKENYNIRTGVATHFLEQKTLSMWVTDEITSPKKIKQDAPTAKFEPVITNEKTNVPAIKKGICTQYGIGLRTRAGATKRVPVSKTVMWHELTQEDTVVNKDLKQIYPTATGKIPMALAELLQHVR